jgi:sugar phosphate isomerase/epimerase
VWIGLMTDSLRHLPREEVLDRCARWGIRSVELGTGNFSPAPHVDLQALLRDRAERERLLRDVRGRGLRISALNCSGNPLHPRSDVAGRHSQVVRDTVALAGLLEVDTVVTMSGCPGAPGGGDVPNWVVSAWPPEFVEAVEWQWRERVVPFWQELAEWAGRHGVRLAVEMHPGQCVYNPMTLLRLREAAGPRVGANLDPSHLFWQGVDVLDTVRRLGPAIFHVHAKDTRLDSANVRRDGVLHLAPGQPPKDRPWAFRTLGLGHDAFFWAQFVDELQQVGYAGALSVEHEDEVLSPEDGVLRSVQLLRAVLPQDVSFAQP